MWVVPRIYTQVRPCRKTGTIFLNILYSYNKASQRIAEKLGFTLESRIRDRKDAQGKRCDLLRYGLLKSEREERKL